MADTAESSETTTSISTTTLTDPASIAVYNRGPATAIFTPPTSCLKTLTSKSDMYVGHRTTGYFDPACYPASTTDRGLAGWDVYYYSPAQCPSGWASATRLISSIGRGETYLTIGSDTTAVVCCPSNFRYVGDGDGHQCKSAFTSTSSTLLYITPTMNGNNQWTDTSLGNPMTLVATADPDYNVYNDGIPIFYQESDLAAFARATSTSSTATPSRTTSQTTSPTATSSPSASSTGSSGLSTGAKIGIGVGIPLVVIALGLIGAFFWFRRRGLQRINQTELQDSSAITKAPEQYGGENQIVSELYSDAPYDPHVPREQYELPDTTERR
ncbi:hypothetical protein BKA64DRAFT_92458 [Cadophora sp. MPI-SDFR-AT-0126]|nr:hypothetical protein BKA64DRAFT_92458 [Leotiomycetes sp. MPI-SDFR-AT-0126]